MRMLPFMKKPISKNYLIVGASSGIGKSLVLQIAKKAKTQTGIAIASRKIDELTSLKSEIESKYTNVTVFVRRFDITHFNDAESLIEDCSRALGSIDTIVLNAGISDIIKLGDEDHLKKSKAILDTNLMGPIACISAFVKYAKKIKIQNPYIVTVSSIVSSRVLYIYIGTANISSLWGIKKRYRILYGWCACRALLGWLLDYNYSTWIDQNKDERIYGFAISIISKQ